MQQQKTLRLILGDQLNNQHSWFSKVDNTVEYVMMEITSESEYTTHHIQKIIGFFAAMRAFAAELRHENHLVHYIKISDRSNKHTFESNLEELIKSQNISNFEYQQPDEYRLDIILKHFCKMLTISSSEFDTEHYFTKRNELTDFFKGKKSFLMESFYRSMRHKHSILMDGKEPLTGQWNYDKDNRKKLPQNHRPTDPLLFENEVTEIYNEIIEAKIKTIGQIDPKKYIWPINRGQSLQLLNHFVQECLPLFGTFEDTMAQDYWSIYHSRLAFSMNIKLLSPVEVIDTAVKYWQANQANIEYNQIEGFVRQILGWREYMRGIYWHQMPGFATTNYFENKNELPVWYWTGHTKMNCLSQAIGQSLKYGYAHHIQRLMITGNFALLAGTAPAAVDEWYLGIYIDAIEWVQITNTRGMSQYADGGLIATKPYVSSASYIHKMSNYCSSCFYNKDLKTGQNACPFNSLYWHFFEKNEQLLAKNPRIGMVYNILNKMEPSYKKELLNQAQYYLEHINEL